MESNISQTRLLSRLSPKNNLVLATQVSHIVTNPAILDVARGSQS